MKTTIIILTAITIGAAFSSCGPTQTSTELEYEKWLAKHDSSHKYHVLVYKRHETMCANHEELENFVSNMENPDPELMSGLARHSQFYMEQENIMANHEGIMQDHKDFMKRYQEGKVSEEELKIKLDSIKHDHQHMDIDHEHVLELNTQIRKEHNDMRRRLNDLLEK